MKKLLALGLGFIPCAALAATNKISMVTFFPVPYVAYSQVNGQQMDIGLTNSCDMKLGCSETSATLNAAQVNLKGGKLNLDGGRGIKGDALLLGSSDSGEGRISFQNVRIQTGNMESMNAGDIKTTNLNLFGKAFPSCKDANSESGGQMQWKSLKLAGAPAKELYLACGESQESTCKDEYGSWQTVAAGVKDTCDGDTDSHFYCGDNPNIGTCIDVYVEGGSDTPQVLKWWEPLALNGGTGSGEFAQIGRHEGSNCDAYDTNSHCYADTCNPLHGVHNLETGHNEIVGSWDADKNEITSCSQVTATRDADGSVTCWDVKGVDYGRNPSWAKSYLKYGGVASVSYRVCNSASGGCYKGLDCTAEDMCENVCGSDGCSCIAEAATENLYYGTVQHWFTCRNPQKRQIRCSAGVTKSRTVTCCPK